MQAPADVLWLMLVGGEPIPPEELALTRQALTVLRSLPSSEQRSRVAALRDAERTCAEGDRMEMLTSTSRAQ